MNKKDNELLNRFLRTIEEANKEGEDKLLDIGDIMNTRQFNKFKTLELIIHKLFSANSLYDGLKDTVSTTKLTEGQQISVIAIMKIFETFVSGMNKAQESVQEMSQHFEDSSSVNEDGADGMFI